MAENVSGGAAGWQIAVAVLVPTVVIFSCVAVVMIRRRRTTHDRTSPDYANAGVPSGAPTRQLVMNGYKDYGDDPTLDAVRAATFSAIMAARHESSGQKAHRQQMLSTMLRSHLKQPKELSMIAVWRRGEERGVCVGRLLLLRHYLSLNFTLESHLLDENGIGGGCLEGNFLRLIVVSIHRVADHPDHPPQRWWQHFQEHDTSAGSWPIHYVSPTHLSTGARERHSGDTIGGDGRRYRAFQHASARDACDLAAPNASALAALAALADGLSEAFGHRSRSRGGERSTCSVGRPCPGPNQPALCRCGTASASLGSGRRVC